MINAKLFLHSHFIFMKQSGNSAAAGWWFTDSYHWPGNVATYNWFMFVTFTLLRQSELDAQLFYRTVNLLVRDSIA